MSENPQFSTKWLTDRAADLLVCLRFCTRLPIKALGFEKPPQDASLAASANMLPVAGALIGAAAAIALWLATKLGLASSLSALIAIAALIFLTGALHEDGLADFADALGGTTPEQRLAIMKDSRIGTFGGLALVMTVLARIMSIALLTDRSLGLAGAVLIAAAASSRCFALVPLYLLGPARPDGLGATAADSKQTRSHHRRRCHTHHQPRTAVCRRQPRARHRRIDPQCGRCLWRDRAGAAPHQRSDRRYCRRHTADRRIGHLSRLRGSPLSGRASLRVTQLSALLKPARLHPALPSLNLRRELS